MYFLSFFFKSKKIAGILKNANADNISVVNNGLIACLKTSLSNAIICNGSGYVSKIDSNLLPSMQHNPVKTIMI
jgi:hypothetical protein